MADGNISALASAFAFACLHTHSVRISIGSGNGIRIASGTSYTLSSSPRSTCLVQVAGLGSGIGILGSSDDISASS